MKLRVVVVGAIGQIGRPLCRTLVRACRDRFFCFPDPDAALRDLLAQPGPTTTAAR
jgi:nucleoside-diphosphate-sugar epimerase